MKIEKIEIENYRSLKNLVIYPNDILALVGRNNSGKSNVVKAIQLFFDGSKKLVNEECFYNRKTNKPIRIFITFKNLSKWEKEKFKPWMDGDLLVVGREVFCNRENDYEIKTFAVTKIPEYEWLQHDVISGDKIKEWWSNKQNLKIGNLDFGALLGSSRPNVGDWKKIANNFVIQNRGKIKLKLAYRENPRGYDGVLKGALPQLIYIPAVRDVCDEAKVTKTNPFGRLVNSVLERISGKQKASVSKKLKEIEELLNRGSTGNRIDELKTIEDSLNTLMKELMDCDVEIEMSLPQLGDIFSGAKIYADDGIRTTIETKGHGMQRSFIFTILRAYAEFMCIQNAGEKANQKTTLFVVEEPELYLHPHSQKTLMSVFRKIAGNKDQVIYCTHSSLFVDIAFFDEICIMRRKRGPGGYRYSIATQLFMSQMLEDLKVRTNKDGTEEGIREQYSNVFNPQINEGFFADNVVIVEGPSEEYSLPLYAEALDYNFSRKNISVVHSNGKGPIDRILRVFNGFKLPTYVWFDGDKNKSNEATDQTLVLLELLGDPVQNVAAIKTKVKRHYAVLEEDLDHTIAAEVSDFNALAQECTTVIGPHGKPLKHRYIANKLLQRVKSGEDPPAILPPTIVAIIDRIKKVSYKESILKTQI